MDFWADPGGPNQNEGELMNSMKPNDEGFTGLEAAIVLIAFVVVAAVFSYVVLGAGFFTTQKSQESVHSAVQQTSSTMELSGPVVITSDGSQVTNIKFYLQLAAGGTDVDLTKVVYTLTTATKQDTKLYAGVTYTNAQGTAATTGVLTSADLVAVNVPVTVANTPIHKNDKFTLEVQPATGATLTVVRTVPSAIGTNGADYEVY
jgi:archaeal flagellin FlaB